MSTTGAPSEGARIMMIGMGDLSSRVLTMLLADSSTNRVVLAGRDEEKLRRQANLARFAASNLDLPPDLGTARVDLDDVAATAETIATVRPDLIFMGASLQSWRVITQLPKPVFEELDEAQFGPWLPMHLAPNHLLMRAVRESGLDVPVVNAAFPDAVGPVLATVGLAPTIGIGNVANIVPALTYSAADQLGVHPGRVELRLVAQHYFSHYVPRFGEPGRGSYHLTARLDGRDVSAELDHAVLFKRLTGPLKRLGGVDGQHLTASSAVRVLRALVTGSGALVHAPAPGGLPGGYPVEIGPAGCVVALDDSISLDKAIRLNEECQQADGIAGIDAEGTVTFAEPEMEIMRRLLGYECRRMRLSDAAAWADELGRRYGEFAAKFA